MPHHFFVMNTPSTHCQILSTGPGQRLQDLCRLLGPCSMCTAFLAAFSDGVGACSRVPCGCCTRLKTGTPHQTSQLLGQVAGTPSSRSTPPYKGNPSHNLYRGNRSPPPSCQTLAGSSQLLSSACQRKHVHRSSARC